MRLKKRREKKILNVFPFLLFLLFISGFFLSIGYIYSSEKNSFTVKKIEQKFKKSGINCQYYNLSNTFKINTPSNKIESTLLLLGKIISAYNGKICNYNTRQNKIELKINFSDNIIKFEINKYDFKKKIYSKAVKNNNKTHYKLAIIIDDAGYKNKNTLKFLRYPEKLTISILPFLPNSRKIAELAHKYKKQVMLHMPMEPLNYKKRKIRVFPYTILTTLSDHEIEQRVNNMLNAFNFIEGVNNHQGSKATKDYRTMYNVLINLKKKNLFFVDSLTSNKSVVKKICERIKLSYGTRDIFLDNEKSYDYIKKQMDKLINLTLRRGYAIGIGHISSSNLIKVLFDYINVFKQKNIELVYPSEIIKNFTYKEVI